MDEKPQQFVLCSFCDEKFPIAEVGQHLMMCGNKTDECPNCRKFIRRAIFAYHYENKCANLDETDNNVSAPAANRPDAMKTAYPTTDSTTSDSTSQRSNSAFCETKRITTGCQFCNQQCELADRNVHRDNCLQNPVNIDRRQRAFLGGTANQNSERSHLDDTSAIPCEYCREPIEWHRFEEHTKLCAKRGQERSRIVNGENGFTAPCKHCGVERSLSGLAYHELFCNGYSRWSAYGNRFISTFHFPSLSRFGYR